MKTTNIITTLCLAVCLLISTAAAAHHDHFNAIYNKYKDRDAVFTMTFNPGNYGSMFKSNDKDVKEILKNVNQVKLLVYDLKPGQGNGFKDELKKCFVAGDFKDMMTINDGGDHIEIKAVKENDKITEMIIVITDKDSIVVLYMDGNMDLKGAQKLAKQVASNGLTA